MYRETDVVCYETAAHHQGREHTFYIILMRKSHDSTAQRHMLQRSWRVGKTFYTFESPAQGSSHCRGAADAESN